MTTFKSKLSGLAFKLVGLLLMLLIFLPSFPAYALDNNYVVSEYNEWLEVDDITSYEKSSAGFDGFLKKAVDEENGCFYMYFSFYDTRLGGYDDENVVISFDVWNDVNSYSFSVNRNGFVNTGVNEQNNIKIAYNFNSCSINGCGGEILLGFELTNKIDRQLYNYISCEYAGGLSNTAVLFDKECMDMYVAPTVKETTTNAVKTTAKAAKSTIAKSTALTSEKAESSKTESAKTTKYTPTGTVKSNSKTEQSAKFSGSNVYQQSSAGADNEDTEEITVALRNEIVEGKYQMSKTAVVVLGVAAAMIVAGIVCVIVGVAVKSKKEKIPENSSNNGEN